jgi:hypothetical protein
MTDSTIEKLMMRAARALDYADAEQVAEKFVAEGVAKETAFLAVQGGKILARDAAPKDIITRAAEALVD